MEKQGLERRHQRGETTRDGINENERCHQQALEMASTRRIRTDRRVHKRQH